MKRMSAKPVRGGEAIKTYLKGFSPYLRPHTAYHLQFKGFVGCADSDGKAVDNILENNQGKHVNVLIEQT